MRRINRLAGLSGSIWAALVAGCTVEPDGLRAVSPGGQRGAGGADPARLAKEVGSGVFGKPFVLHGTELVMVPYSVVRPEERSKFNLELFSGSSFSSSSSGGSYSFSGSAGGLYQQDADTHWNNLLFYDKRGGDARLLLDGRAVIVQAFVPQAPGGTPSPQQRQPIAPHLLLVIAEADTNGNGYINGADATVLHHLSLPDLSMTPLSPPGGQFEDLTPDDAGRVLYVRSLADTDGDRSFTQVDDAVIARVDLTSPGPGTPIIPDELRRRAFSVIAGQGE